MKLERIFCQKYTENSKEVTKKNTSIKIYKNPKNIMADALHTSKCPELYYITVQQLTFIIMTLSPLRTLYKVGRM